MTLQTTFPSSVDLDVIELDVADGRYQTLVINLPQPSVLIEPSVLPQLTLPQSLDVSREVILFGQAPIWLYCYLIRQCQAAPWIGCYNALSGNVVIIHSSHPQFQVGDAIAPQLNTTPGVAVLIGGPPDSGKSLLSNALRLAIAERYPTCRQFLHRANWDGQGNWTYETPDPALVDQLVAGFDAKLHWHPEAAKLLPKYFNDQATTIQNLRNVRDLVFVDVGGVPQPEKHPVVQTCSHYIIISCKRDVVPSWHMLCARSLDCLAVLHSGADNTDEKPNITPDETSTQSPSSPFLELQVSLKAIVETGTLPIALIDAISQLILGNSTIGAR